MGGFFEALWARPAELSLLSRYTIANGCLYAALGALVMALPADWLALALFVPSLDGLALGLARALGICLFFIGWFYGMDGRTGATSFGLATVVDRLFLPLQLGALLATGQLPLELAAPLGVLDPLLGLGALWIWRRERVSAAAA